MLPPLVSTCAAVYVAASNSCIGEDCAKALGYVTTVFQDGPIVTASTCSLAWQCITHCRFNRLWLSSMDKQGNVRGRARLTVLA